MDINKSKCEKCGAENPLTADFCAECGKNLSKNLNSGSNPISRWFSNWNKKSSGYKIITGLLGCCIGAFIIILILGAIFPTTALSLENTTINIDNQTTEYLLKGKTEAGATVKINSKTLNINNVEVKPAADGKFEYKLQIPTNINESEVIVSAKVPNKSENQATATIKRPSTTQTSAEPKIDPNYKTFNSSFITFQYPKDWKIAGEGKDFVKFNTSSNDFGVRVGFGVNLVIIENFPYSGKSGNTEYKYMKDGDVLSFAVRRDGKDLHIVGASQDETGMKKILETFKFK
ncbi:MAG: zinc ribbon domain-containing protein [Candidatus Methanofastidiosa archaeon]|nr:zinc ribbon domain-containing protein [Candidatus Methanofastidiosa archaeon]